MGVGPKGDPWKQGGTNPRSTGRKLKSDLAVSNDPAFGHPQKDYSHIGKGGKTSSTFSPKIFEEAFPVTHKTPVTPKISDSNKRFKNTSKLKTVPTFSEIKNQINKAIIKNPKLRRSMPERDYWIKSFFREYDVSKQEIRRARVFLTCSVTELNRK